MNLISKHCCILLGPLLILEIFQMVCCRQVTQGY
jgi:hypothetical protein